jgi:hypothetical protein
LSAKIRWHPAAVRASVCRSRFWSRVETRALAEVDLRGAGREGRERVVEVELKGCHAARHVRKQ